ncbi:MAG: hypothetical protein RR383_01230 [Muribaculaceae bacterium]
MSKDPGFKVPDNYFNDFAERMTKSLPEREFTIETPPSLWHRARPWIYMAAMFVGIWCMMKVFTTMRDDSSDNTINPSIAEAFKNESFVDDYVLTDDFDEYELLQEMYEDSVNVGAAFGHDSIN